MDYGFIIKISASAIIFALFFILKAALSHKRKENPDDKKIKRKSKLYFWIMIIAAWYFIACTVTELMGGLKGINVDFELFSDRSNLFGLSISNSTITIWYIMGVITVLSLIFRFLVLPKFKGTPKGIQNVIELSVEAVDNFTKSAVGNLGGDLSSYMFSTALLLIGCAFVELLGIRPPTSDLVVTASLGLVTFFLLNYYGLKKKGFGGRIKSLASPSPIIFPMKVLSDVAIPVSLACRLFGNMLGGMIVMDLLKTSLGGYAIGLTTLSGLYFNLFHPLIQTYIFITLSLTFINEAAE